MEERKINRYENQTINSINKPFTVLGFKPQTFMIMLGAIVLLFIISWVVLVIFIIALIAVSTVLINAQKKGDYNYLKELISPVNRHGEIIDDGISSIINSNEERSNKKA